ncbi:hypothetical protein J8I87_10595 [Paraburkholderia sp. LEh10]|uniref:hypothetical protein n=1 Tax=Paraburkholderia sp. LEh10 TaxID=2821353 RepID=UPI001AE8735B|nr:hypothetical protein [Paraburkholderia sp. LEh10]MBP0590158.1 hypothetical protein [Paraburkholderia sp. LEh10]
MNMAAGMIYTMGGSFWEFGGLDLDRAKESDKRLPLLNSQKLHRHADGVKNCRRRLYVQRIRVIFEWIRGCWSTTTMN